MKTYTRQDFLKQIKRLVKYWSENGTSKLDVADGVAFSILCMIDGCSGDCPMLTIINTDSKMELTNWDELHSEYCNLGNEE